MSGGPVAALDAPNNIMKIENKKEFRSQESETRIRILASPVKHRAGPMVGNPVRAAGRLEAGNLPVQNCIDFRGLAIVAVMGFWSSSLVMPAFGWTLTNINIGVDSNSVAWTKVNNNNNNIAAVFNSQAISNAWFAGQLQSFQANSPASFSDTVDAFDEQNAYNYGANTGIQVLFGANSAQVLVYRWPNGNSVTPFFKNAAVFAAQGLTNFNLALTLTGTNAGWCFTNTISIGFLTNGGPNGFGRYLPLNTPAISAGTSNLFVTTNLTFSVPLGIVTNTIAIQPNFYNNGSSNEFFLHAVLSN